MLGDSRVLKVTVLGPLRKLSIHGHQCHIWGFDNYTPIRNGAREFLCHSMSLENERQCNGHTCILHGTTETEQQSLKNNDSEPQGL